MQWLSFDCWDSVWARGWDFIDFASFVEDEEVEGALPYSKWIEFQDN